MHILELNKQKIIKCINENKTVIVCYYNKNDIISDLMIGTMNLLRKKINDDIIIIISEGENDDEKNECYPKINIYRNSHLDKSLIGFFSYKKIIKNLNKII